MLFVLLKCLAEETILMDILAYRVLAGVTQLLWELLSERLYSVIRCWLHYSNEGWIINFTTGRDLCHHPRHKLLQAFTYDCLHKIGFIDDTLFSIYMYVCCGTCFCGQIAPSMAECETHVTSKSEIGTSTDTFLKKGNEKKEDLISLALKLKMLPCFFALMCLSDSL